MESLDATCAAIAAEERAVADQRLQRLSQAVEHDLTKLQSASERMKADLDDIDAFLSACGIELPSSSDPSGLAPAPAPPTPAAMCRLLTQSSSLLSQAGALATPTPAGLLAPPVLAPLPREAEAQRGALTQFPRVLALLRVKDELLRFAQASRKGLMAEQHQHAAALAKLYDATRAEIDEWVALSQRLTSEARALKQKCCFCGTPLSGAAASTPCPANQPRAAAAVTPAQLGSDSTRREGDGLHFFVQESP